MNDECTVNELNRDEGQGFTMESNIAEVKACEVPEVETAALPNPATPQKRRSTKKTSRFRGVCWLPRRQAWRARIERGGNRIHIGYFATEMEAAKAYDQYSFSISGHNGRFNFPEDFGQGGSLSVEERRRSNASSSTSSTRLSTKRASIASATSTSTGASSLPSDGDHERSPSSKRQRRVSASSNETGSCARNPDAAEGCGSSAGEQRPQFAMLQGQIRGGLTTPPLPDLTQPSFNSTLSPNAISNPRLSFSASPATPLSMIRHSAMLAMTSPSSALGSNNGLMAGGQDLQNKFGFLQRVPVSISPVSGEKSEIHSAFKFDDLKQQQQRLQQIRDELMQQQVQLEQSIRMNTVLEELRRPSLAMFNALMQRYR